MYIKSEFIEKYIPISLVREIYLFEYFHFLLILSPATMYDEHVKF